MKLLDMFKTKRAAVHRTAWQEYADILSKGDNVRPADVERLEKLRPELGFDLTAERLEKDTATLQKAAALAHASANLAEAQAAVDKAEKAAIEHGTETFRMKEKRDAEWFELNAAASELRARLAMAQGSASDLERLKVDNPHLLSWSPPAPWDLVRYEQPQVGTLQREAMDIAGGNHPDPETFDRVWQDVLVRMTVDKSFTPPHATNRKPITPEAMAEIKPESYAGVLTFRRAAIRQAAGDSSNYHDKRNIEVARQRIEEHRIDEENFATKGQDYVPQPFMKK